MNVKVLDLSTWYAAISAYASLGAVACALLVVWLQNRSARRLLGFQLFAQMAKQYDSQEMLQARSRLADTLLADEASLDVDETVLMHYENLALLVRRRLIDRQLVWNIYSYDAPRYWFALSSYIRTFREKYSEPSYLEEFEGMVKWLNSIKRSPLGTRLHPREFTSSDLRDFLRTESNRAATR